MNYKDDPRYQNLKAMNELLAEWEIEEMYFKELHRLKYEELAKYSKDVAPIKKKIKNYAKFKEVSPASIYIDIYNKFGITCQIDIQCNFEGELSILHGIYSHGYFESFKEFLNDYFNNNGNITT